MVMVDLQRSRRVGRVGDEGVEADDSVTMHGWSLTSGSFESRKRGWMSVVSRKMNLTLRLVSS